MRLLTAYIRGGGVALFLNVRVFKGFLKGYFLLKGFMTAFTVYISYQKGFRRVLIRIFLSERVSVGFNLEYFLLEGFQAGFTKDISY